MFLGPLPLLSYQLLEIIVFLFGRNDIKVREKKKKKKEREREYFPCLVEYE